MVEYLINVTKIQQIFKNHRVMDNGKFKELNRVSLKRFFDVVLVVHTIKMLAFQCVIHVSYLFVQTNKKYLFRERSGQGS